MTDQAREILEKTLKKAREFTQSTNFYPPQIVFDINKIERSLAEMDKEEAYYFKQARDLDQFIQHFKRLHKEAQDFIGIKTQNTDLLMLKNNLFLQLQRGDLKEAEITIRELKKANR
jgi:hypothetical protein